jgi:hypothetical protein
MNHIRTNSKLLTLALLLAVSSVLAFSQSSHEKSGHRLINEKAMAVNPADMKSMTELVDAIILAYPMSRDLIGTSGELHDHLVLAESAYHNGNHPGVSEAHLARFLNRLAALINAPSWAYTRESEVRRLRATMLISSPALVGIQPASHKHETPAGITSRMSPAESVFVLSSLAFQKLHNPEWQLTPEEEKVTWIVRHSPGHKPEWANNQRSVELQEKIDSAASRVSLRDLYEVAQESLAEIEKGGQAK